MMEKFNFGDIVLLKFPHSDGITFSKRPALTIADTGDGDVILCRITSQLYKSVYDIEIIPTKVNGLKLTSSIRVHKLATIEKDRIERKLGSLESSLKDQVRRAFSKLV